MVIGVSKISKFRLIYLHLMENFLNSFFLKVNEFYKTDFPIYQEKNSEVEERQSLHSGKIGTSRIKFLQE
ncbi:hypothetical protein L3Y34_018060 [Caenorhabditis briggsae]|uniref:Uncharacterized protein n=1 Tax=Caenorhabditis briggsae TaxID=6238 RepID=A0AAE9IU89_CAEBR|nr:hypothetical protein L3Y34_018060 [Caenorhabditis briggsae]